jgi:cytidine deaminase
MDFNPLLAQARIIRENAYAPYSHFPIGAALLTKSGKVFLGCNVENISFGLSICAERNAVFSAVAAGEREFEAIAIIADSKTPVTPCGGCRQVMAEFAPDMPLCSSNLEGEVFVSCVKELLPRAKEGILGT